MGDINKMVIGVFNRLLQSYKTLIREKTRNWPFMFKILLTAFAVLCYPLVSLILIVILLLVICIVVPISLTTKFNSKTIF